MTSKYDGATLEVVNWEKYNPRGDSARPVWFRFENSIATSAAFFDLDCEQKWLWVVILSLVSQRNGESIEWNSRFIQATTGIKPAKQDQTIEIFEKYARLRVTRKVTSEAPYAGNPLRTNEHNDTNETNTRRLDFDFEALYKKYPRKEGKSAGLKKAKKQILTQEDYDALSRAIDRFSEHHRAKQTEAKYIPHFSTFMSSWLDWLDPETGSAHTNAPISIQERLRRQEDDDKAFAREMAELKAQAEAEARAKGIL